MRTTRSACGPLLATLTTLAACSLVACGGSGGGPGGPPAPRGFTLRPPDATIQAGEELVTCWYVLTPNVEPLSIKRWSASLGAGVHEVILYTTPTELKPSGTVSATDCGSLGGSTLPSWIVSVRPGDTELALPADDGAGKPLGQPIAAGTPAILVLHYQNVTAAPITASVALTAEAHAAGVAATPTAAFVTFDGNISIPPGAAGHTETQTCATPDGAKFWSLSTRTHKQGVLAEVRDGEASSTTVLVSSTDWERPLVHAWSAPGFFTSAAGQLTTTCTYDNTGSNSGRVVVSGSSPSSDETCMAIGYWFPADRPRWCINGIGPL